MHFGRNRRKGKVKPIKLKFSEMTTIDEIFTSSLFRGGFNVISNWADLVS